MHWLQAFIFITVLLTSHGANPHEMGTTQVHFTVHGDHTWTAVVTTAPQALVNRIEARRGEARSSGLDEGRMRAKLNQFAQMLAANIDVRFDGIPSGASISISRLELPAHATLPAFVTLLVKGQVPENAQRVTWRYGLVYSTYAVVFVNEDESRALTQWLDGDVDSQPFSIVENVRPPTQIELFGRYLSLGFFHIIPEGLDHILFVLGIFLLTTEISSILLQITAFTIAHSMSLALTMYGLVSLPSRVVEPMIALSIAYVAIENIVTSKLNPLRPAVVFGFGLLHGLGFAGALTGLRLSQTEIIPALFSFNIGIEAAQLTVIAVAFLTVVVWHQNKPWYRRRLAVPASAMIAATGVFWTVQRIAGL